MRIDTQWQRMMTGARNYAAFDNSDPFAYNRAVSHMHSSVASVRVALHNNDPRAGEDAFYAADPVSEDHKGTIVVTYRNVRRP